MIAARQVTIKQQFVYVKIFIDKDSIKKVHESRGIKGQWPLGWIYLNFFLPDKHQFFHQVI